MRFCRMNPIAFAALCLIFLVGRVAVCLDSTAPTSTKPMINSVTYSPSTDLRSGDSITVEVSGTPGGGASFEIQHYVPLTAMNESAPGIYWREFRLPRRGVKDATVVAYLTLGNAKAAPVQAGKLLTVTAEPEALTARPLAPDTAPGLSVTTRATQTAQSISRPVVAPLQPPITVVKVTDTTKRPEQARELDKVLIKTPRDGATLRTAILVTGKASPGSKLAVSITYNNGLSGLMKLSGQVASQVIAVGEDGSFRMGPFPLEGALATKGLRFTVKAYYADRSDHGTAVVSAIGDRR